MISLMRLGRYVLFIHMVFVAAAFVLTENKQVPDPHEIPVMDGQAGPCLVTFTVTGDSGVPVYDAKIRVHIEYGFAGMRRLDLEAATNIDGKAQFKGLPKKVKGGVLHFSAARNKLVGSATYDPGKSCAGENDSIMLTENKSD